MGHHTHDDVARRWAQRTLGSTAPALKSRNLYDEGDSIYSYGRHFEVARVLRDTKRQPRAFLLNGNRYSVTTAKHQNAVRGAIQNYHDMPVITIPHDALSVAGIDLDSIEIIDLQDDWWTTTIVTKDHLVGSWTYDYTYDPAVYQNSLTGEVRAPEPNDHWATQTPAAGTCERCETPLPHYWESKEPWEAYAAKKAEREAHVRARHGVWERVAGRVRNTGRKRAFLSAHIEWDLVDDPTAPLGYRFEREVRRHWLGASLIRAAVPYMVNVKHRACNGTGRTEEPRIIELRGEAEGPLTEWQMDAHTRNQGWVNQRRAERGEELLLPGWHVDGSALDYHCRGCSGRGKVRQERHRWAYFLSGFDQNETRPSYFFCELPPKVRPATVEEAYEALKPEAVKLAESMSREVKRQGDIFAIPMPGLTAAQLRADGGVHRKRVAPVEEVSWWTNRGRRRTANRRVTEHLAHVLGTNHEATEVFDMPNGQTYARGALVHEPGAGREPDHKRLTLGREWHLIVKNTVPTT